MSQPISDMRIPYTFGHVDDDALLADPFEQFQVWFDEARETNISEANAMTVATVDANGMPDARTILMKGFDRNGLVFYTNYDSTKGQELEQHPVACLLFYWPTLERQVRWRGRIEKVSADESDTYYHSRPRGSQIGAHASPQSQPVPGRAWLNELFASKDAEFEHVDPIPRPAYWGGYRLVPETVEFWQGRENRMHDRMFYTRTDDGAWSQVRLAP